MRILTPLLGLWLVLSASGATLQFNFGDYEYNSTPTNFQSLLAGGGTQPVWKIISAEVPSGYKNFQILALGEFHRNVYRARHHSNIFVEWQSADDLCSSGAGS